MPLLSGSNLAKSYGAEDIFSGLTFSIPHNGHIGLVGSNGVGKTTLLRVLVGEEDPSEGEIFRSRNLRIGYLPQQARFTSGNNLWEECLLVFADLLRLQKELRGMEAQMGSGEPDTQTMETYGRLQQNFELQGGYTYEHRIRTTLMGLGFGEDDLHRPMEQFSGGQRTRALLARLLLSSPDLLLLDEPTNHLDIAAVEWLENYLSKEWQGAYLVVSHDRYFIDQVVSTVWEMSPALEIYRGNYSAYLKQREERYHRRLEEYAAQQEFIEKEEEYIQRNIAGQNTRQAQGRRRRLERLLEEARLAPPSQPRRFRFHLQESSRSGDLVLRTHNLQVGYADAPRPLFTPPDITLQRQECAAIIGPNGCGKTTFLKTILGLLPPYAGEVLPGASLSIGYFAQAHEDLHPEWTLMEEIQAVCPSWLPEDVRNHLARFLFTGEDVFKQVGMLSGGERGRLALACLALKQTNVLLLDEPTNHLDLPAQEILQSVLSDYQGTILMVSHDRYLIDALATQVWEIIPAEASLRFFQGSYSEYRAHLQTLADQSRPVEQRKKGIPTPDARPEGLSKHEVARRQKRIDALEAEIQALDLELGRISAQLETPPSNPALLQRLTNDYTRLQEETELLLQEWEQLLLEIEDAA